ncbi:GNAT family N-acetyltransferase [Aciditerrimonas ferrireducens]|uniref:GNAT family N-acetyltransferase n=1 Tax=Aciditerrimonas ferrireducens TaxID=667306 RepID=A0ABV6C0Y2_9ACTN
MAQPSGTQPTESRRAPEDQPVQVEEATEATPELLKALQRLLPQLSASAPPLTEDRLRTLLAHPGVHLFVARVGDQVRGTLTLTALPLASGLRATIEDVVVDEEARGQGLGRALTEAALTKAAALGARTVDLTSRPSREAANRLYQRLGFQQRQTNVYRFDLAVQAARTEG